MIYKRPIQDGNEYMALTEQIRRNADKLHHEYIADKDDMVRILDEIQASVTNLRTLLELDKSEQPDNLDASPFLHNSGNKVMSYERGDVRNLRVVTQFGQILQKGDELRDARDPVDKPWKFESVTHPRKVNVSRKADETGTDQYPNREMRTFYPIVFNLGIWDIQYQEWTDRPGWPNSVMSRVEDKLHKARA